MYDPFTLVLNFVGSDTKLELLTSFGFDLALVKCLLGSIVISGTSSQSALGLLIVDGGKS